MVRMAVGQLGFSPEMLRDNLKAALDRLKQDAASLPEDSEKKVDEVVLSSTNSPGFSSEWTISGVLLAQQRLLCQSDGWGTSSVQNSCG